jgi:hypothetical protein
MAAETRTPRASWKADEAEFFLQHLRTSTSAASFAFFLSAFLNAAYSCREILRLEATQDKAMSREEFDHWDSNWMAALSDDGLKIWKFGRDARRLEVHLRGAQTVSVSGLVAAKTPPSNDLGEFHRAFVTGRPPGPTGPLLDDATLRALSEVVAVEFATIRHFDIAGKRLEVVTVCAQYLSLLRWYISDLANFTASHKRSTRPEQI